MNADPSLVIASLAPTPSLYDYASNAVDALRKAVAANQYERRHQREGEPFRNWSIMSEASFLSAFRAHYLSKPLVEITADDFHEALGCLPPVAWEHRDGVERFIVSEAEAGTFHSQFAECNGRYFRRMVDIKDRSTWITGAEIAKHVAAGGYVATEQQRRAGGTGRGVC